jgi:EmrB/QacA subfamily drug resistance transporter
VSRADGFRTVALIVACALFMENLDGAVIVTALPQIARAFATDPVSLSIAITGYLLSVAVFIPASGWVADRFGARTIFLAAIVVFTVASALCGLSNDLVTFTLARILQGIGGAMMVPVGRLVLVRSVEKAHLMRAMAYLTVPALVGSVLGPPLGGFVVTYVSWRWIFFLNIPIGVLGFLLVLRFIENDREAAPPRFDRIGFVWSGLALSGLVFGLEWVQHGGLSAPLVLLLALSGIAFVLYVRHARRCPDPILDLRLLRIPTFRVTFFAGNLFRISAGSVSFLIPMMLQVGFGRSAFETGLLTFIGATGSLVMRVMAHRFVRRLGFRAALAANGLLCAALLALHALLSPATPVLLIMALLFASGFFRALQFNAVFALNFADVGRAEMSRGTALASTAQQVSQSIGVAVGALVLNLTLAWRGAPALAADDFWPAFLTVAAIGAVSGLMFLRLERDAGAAVSGHRRL